MKIRRQRNETRTSINALRLSIRSEILIEFSGRRLGIQTYPSIVCEANPPPRPPCCRTWMNTYSERTNEAADRKSTRLNSSHVAISYAVFCLKKKTSNREFRLDTCKTQVI